MIKFTYQYDKDGVLVEVTLPSDSSLGDILEQFAGFLRAAGYSFDGVIDIVEGEFEQTK